MHGTWKTHTQAHKHAPAPVHELSLRRRHTHINIVMSFRLPQKRLAVVFQCGFSLSLSLSLSLDFCLIFILRVAMSCGWTYTFPPKKNPPPPNILRPNWEKNETNKIATTIYDRIEFLEAKAFCVSMNSILRLFSLSLHCTAFIQQQIEPKKSLEGRIFTVFFFHLKCVVSFLILHPFTFIASFNVTNWKLSDFYCYSFSTPSFRCVDFFHSQSASTVLGSHSFFGFAEKTNKFSWTHAEIIFGDSNGRSRERQTSIRTTQKNKSNLEKKANEMV